MIQLNDSKDITPAWVRKFVLDADHPCLMAQLAVKTQSVNGFDIANQDYEGSIPEAYDRIKAFASNPRTNAYSSFLLSFSGLRRDMSEIEFEGFLWRILAQIALIDTSDWDPGVSSDPADAEFSFSTGGKAFYVIGMHPLSSRDARRTPVPAIVFNLHSQFEKLRSTGKYESVRNSIRARDRKLQGSVNPMVADFGTKSEAAQYSGRQTGSNWVCPLPHKH